MDEILQFVTEHSKRLGRPINDLEDVRNAMSALEDIRQNEIRIDMILGPIEVLLQDNNVVIFMWTGFQVAFEGQGVRNEFHQVHSYCSHQIIIHFLLIYGLYSWYIGCLTWDPSLILNTVWRYADRSLCVCSRQEAYGMLNNFEVSVARDEVEGVDTLRYSFEKLLAQAVSSCIMPLRFKTPDAFYSEMKKKINDLSQFLINNCSHWEQLSRSKSHGIRQIWLV